MLNGSETSEGDVTSGDEAMRQRCRSLVGPLVLPVPCTLESLVASVARHTETTIDVQAQDFSADPGLSAMVVGTPTGYAIRYHPSPDPWWVLTCVSHEIGHILAGHGPNLPASAQRPAQDLADGLHDHLDEMQLARAEWGPLYRCQNKEAQEREAEYIASLLVQRIETARSSSLPAYLLGTPGPNLEPQGLLGLLRRRRV